MLNHFKALSREYGIEEVQVEYYDGEIKKLDFLRFSDPASVGASLKQKIQDSVKSLIPEKTSAYIESGKIVIDPADYNIKYQDSRFWIECHQSDLIINKEFHETAKSLVSDTVVEADVFYSKVNSEVIIESVGFIDENTIPCHMDEAMEEYFSDLTKKLVESVSYDVHHGEMIFDLRTNYYENSYTAHADDPALVNDTCGILG